MLLELSKAEDLVIGKLAAQSLALEGDQGGRRGEAYVNKGLSVCSAGLCPGGELGAWRMSSFVMVRVQPAPVPIGSQCCPSTTSHTLSAPHTQQNRQASAQAAVHFYCDLMS